jgi:CRISPR-associated protein Csd2
MVRKPTSTTTKARTVDEDADDGTALRPGPNADWKEEIEECIAPNVYAKYDVYSYRHGAMLMAKSFAKELKEIERALGAFTLTTREIQEPGGNESEIPKKFSKLLRPNGWIETRVQGDLLIRLSQYDEVERANGRLQKNKRPDSEPVLIENFIDGHKIDYVKGRVALDLEWNSKDQTFDRDLYAMRAFHECGLISVGIVVTRSEKLNTLFDVLPQIDKTGKVSIGKNGKPMMCRAKYGASTTWMGKLLYRLNAGRHGGCPILVFGIRPDVVTDWKNHELNPERR